nr:26S protease regulatory subunit 6A homolog [Tanacetum cinerariifolium]
MDELEMEMEIGLSTDAKHRVEVIRILVGQIVRFATMAASPFSLAANSWLRIHTTIRSVTDLTKENANNSCELTALSDAADYFVVTVDGNNSEPVINRADILDPALMRSGQLDCKIEFIYPTEEVRACILQDVFTKVICDCRKKKTKDVERGRLLVQLRSRTNSQKRKIKKQRSISIVLRKGKRNETYWNQDPAYCLWHGEGCVEMAQS